MYTMKVVHIKNDQCGFTLLEILLVITAMIFLAGIVISAVNPNKQLADARNTQRQSDVTQILNAIYQYTIDNTGFIPTSIVASTTCGAIDSNLTIYANGFTPTSTTFTDLSHLTSSQKYLTGIPKDPKETAASSSGYQVYKSSNGRITVCAPRAENSVTISVTR